MTVVTRYHLTCDRDSTLLALGEATDLQQLLHAAEARGWSLASAAEPFAERVDLCPRCRREAEATPEPIAVGA